MSWKLIPSQEIHSWNEKLKATDAAFYQFPYCISGEYTSILSKAIFLKYIADGKEIAYAAITEIGIYPFKIGIIENGPVLLNSMADYDLLIQDLKKFARNKKYMHLQIRPPINSPFDSLLGKDEDFETKLYFPFHKKDDFELNIYNKPEEELLAGFKLQGRRKIVLTNRVPYDFSVVQNEDDLIKVRALFKEVSNAKHYGFQPFKIFGNIYRQGKKHGLCELYTVYYEGKLVNVVLIVKDGKSYYHYTSALMVKGFKANESPPAKLHFLIMKDCFYKDNKSYYNISYGGSDNLVRFKTLYNPVEVEKPPYYTYIIRRKTLSIISSFSEKNAALLRSLIKSFDRLVNN